VARGGSSARSGGSGCGGWPCCTGARCGGCAPTTPRRSTTSSRAPPPSAPSAGRPVPPTAPSAPRSRRSSPSASDELARPPSACTPYGEPVWWSACIEDNLDRYRFLFHLHRLYRIWHLFLDRSQSRIRKEYTKKERNTTPRFRFDWY
jgi:hypothetical protein